MADYDYFKFDRNDSIGNPDIKPRKVGTPQKPVKEQHVESLDAEETTIDGHRVYIQSAAPSSPSDNDIWFDLP